jgi:hypothetical protein
VEFYKLKREAFDFRPNWQVFHLMVLLAQDLVEAYKVSGQFPDTLNLLNAKRAKGIFNNY